MTRSLRRRKTQQENTNDEVEHDDDNHSIVSSHSTKPEEKEKGKEDSKEDSNQSSNEEQQQDKETRNNKKRDPYSLNLFKERQSYFDTLADSSALTQSEFTGFYNFLIIAGGFFIIRFAIPSMLENGTPFDLSLFTHLMSRVDLGYAYFALWTYSLTAFAIQKLVWWNSLPTFVITILQHTSQTMMFVLALSYVYYSEWPFIQSGFFVCNLVVTWFKMHSYTSRNKTLRMEYLKALETGEEIITSAERFGYSNTMGLKYPQNITLRNFLVFLITPTFVYEAEYPRTESIRPLYLMEKAVSAIGAVTVMYILVGNVLSPEFAMIPQRSVLKSLSVLLLPMCLFYFLLFFLVFECIANFFAELTMFADRHFYSDWWNCTSFEEFATKWNHPVHAFLLRHVYLESLYSFKASKGSAMFVTFLLSSLLHELVMVASFRVFRPFLFAMQMMQLPLFIVSKRLKGTRFGNFFFWFGLLMGFPVIAILYVTESYNAMN
eukprot:TRINITY_DN655_c0_g1_i1.p1 TRINITY_DN655_c0_g1~~TRINITY_DN655_c0_g1_i1.p1  ORF type:complete len:491 (-),score=135.76 TRINITY_DN655_c0_g1_i1:200-1672(-)